MLRDSVPISPRPGDDRLPLGAWLLAVTLLLNAIVSGAEVVSTFSPLPYVFPPLTFGNETETAAAIVCMGIFALCAFLTATFIVFKRKAAPSLFAAMVFAYLAFGVAAFWVPIVRESWNFILADGPDLLLVMAALATAFAIGVSLAIYRYLRALADSEILK